jgi:hypothetical protein
LADRDDWSFQQIVKQKVVLDEMEDTPDTLRKFYLHFLDWSPVLGNCSPHKKLKKLSKNILIYRLNLPPRIIYFCNARKPWLKWHQKEPHHMPEISLVEAINQAWAYEMAIDEDVGINSGVFRATVGLQTRFGEVRVMDTPLAESMIAGISIGLKSVNG